MTDKELKKVLAGIQQIPNESERDEVTQIVLKAAAESITLETLKKITAKPKKEEKQEQSGGSVKFTKKEIEQMPEKFKRFFVLDENIVSYRITKDGLYQARFRRCGYNIEVAHKDFATMKHRFLKKLAEAEKKLEQIGYPLFKEYAAGWLKEKQRTVKESTYKGYEQLVRVNLIPAFGEMSLKEITRKEVQELLFSYVDQGKNRTAQKLKVMLTAMFDVIVDDYPALTNPMRKIVLNHYEVKKGHAFTKEEEKQIIDFCKQHPHYHGNSALLLLMYTGMRVGELKTMDFDGEYVTCISEKTRKGRKEVVRKIPVSPMLKKILHMIDFEKAKNTNRDVARDTIKRIFPDRHTHELRYTFITRAKECGVNPEVVMLWVGHEHDQDVRTSKVDRGYTTYSEEYLRSEILKIDYEYEQKC
ncbi:MAG: hypothetical protein E7364_01220 [Clostridiales bacterium]|nr:hypothetical protein [Clostridiales bacterium]